MSQIEEPRDEARARGALLPVVLGVVLLLVVAGGAWLISGGRGPLPTPGAQGDPTRVKPCTPDARDPGPLLDLGVQPATGDDQDPLLSRAAVEGLVEKAQRAGAQVISTDAAWSSVEPVEGGTPDFRGIDRVVAAARSRGLEVHITLTGSPAWAVPRTEPGSRWWAPETPEQLRAWTSYVALVMRHLQGKVTYVEVWQEPNVTRFWRNGPDPRAFARLLRATYPVVKRIDPQAQVVSGGIAGNDVGYFTRVYDALEADGGLGEALDLIGVHPFSGAHAPTDANPGLAYDKQPFGAYDERFTGYTRIHDLAASDGGEAPDLYLGAFGYSTRRAGGTPGVSDATRARWAGDAMGVATCTPYVAALGWYYLHPTPWDPAPWTLLDAQGRPDRTYDALRAWTTQRARQVG